MSIYKSADNKICKTPYGDLLSFSKDSDALVLIVNTTNAGTTTTKQFYLPVYGSNIRILTDEQDLVVNSPITLEWTTGGIYSIKIYNANYLKFNNEYDKAKLLSIRQWGNMKWTTMNNAFNGCSNFNISAIDAPDLSICTDMSFTFSNCNKINSNINNWNVSNIVLFTDFMLGVTMSTANYDALLVAWNGLDLANNLTVNFGSSKYTTVGQAAKNQIISDDGWTFIDGGLA